jgi:hypothetical protein
MASPASGVGTRDIKHVLLLSIDGMHAVDLYNRAHGIAAVNARQSLLSELGGIEP